MENSHKHNIHKVLAHSYFMYFVLFLIGITLDLIFSVRLFSDQTMVSVGMVLLVVSTLLILWAQKTSRNLKKETITKETFCRGPYSYTRTPTHLGLFLLMLGFGFITNAFFVILLAFIAFFVSKFIFLHQEEQILVHKYGEPYLAYKKIVRF